MEMTDHETITKNYIAAWNETDPARRQKFIEAAFTADAQFQDPIMQGRGRTEIGALMDGVQQQYPGFRFALKGKPDGFADQLRFSWTLGPDGVEAPIEGTDICVVESGRLQSVTGFFDKVPAA
jgi:hypothetical protein